jgi:hypothetical protein
MRGVPVDALVGVEHHGLFLRVGSIGEAHHDPRRKEYDVSKKHVSVDASRQGRGHKREMYQRMRLATVRAQIESDRRRSDGTALGRSPEQIAVAVRAFSCALLGVSSQHFA